MYQAGYKQRDNYDQHIYNETLDIFRANKNYSIGNCNDVDWQAV